MSCYNHCPKVPVRNRLREWKQGMNRRLTLTSNFSPLFTVLDVDWESTDKGLYRYKIENGEWVKYIYIKNERREELR